MHLEQLQYLIEIDRTGSISSAANHLHVSQSAISKSVSRLEQQLGLVLFHRLRSGVIATDIGRELIHKAREVLDKANEFQQLADDYQQHSPLKLSLACVPMFTRLLSEALETFLSGYPAMRIEMTEKNSKDILHDLRSEHIDIGIMILNPHVQDDPRLKHTILMDTTIYGCVNRNSPLAERRSLTPEDLLAHPIVSYNGSMMEWLNQYLSKESSLQYTIVTNNMESIKRKIAQSSAVSLLSELTIDNHAFLAGGDIIAIPLYVHKQPFSQQLAMVRNHQVPSTKIARDLQRALEQTIATLPQTTAKSPAPRFPEAQGKLL